MTDLVPGDIVHLDVGSIVPADVRLLERLAASSVTSRSSPASRSRPRSRPSPVPAAPPLAELSSCLFMGTVVHEGDGRRCRGRDRSPRPQFGRIAVGLGERHPQTEFQLGLHPLLGPAGQGRRGAERHDLRDQRRCSDDPSSRPCCSRWLWRWASPRSCCRRSSRPASPPDHAGSPQKKVLVKRLVCIEDLGDIDVLFTDKTGTLTDGHISFERDDRPRRAPTAPRSSRSAWCATKPPPTDDTAVGGNPLDVALWEAPGATR